MFVGMGLFIKVKRPVMMIFTGMTPRRRGVVSLHQRSGVYSSMLGAPIMWSWMVLEGTMASMSS